MVNIVSVEELGPALSKVVERIAGGLDRYVVTRQEEPIVFMRRPSMTCKPRNQRYSRLTLGLFGILLCSGCAFNRDIAIGHIYTLKSPEALQPHKLVYRAHIAEEVNVDQYDTIVIPKVDIDPSTSTQDLAERVGETFRSALQARLTSILPSQRVVLSSIDATDSKTLTVQCAFREFSPGNGFMRWFLGLGVGAAKIQVEGRGLASGQNDAVFEFVRKRARDGNPVGGFNILVFSNERMLKKTAEDLANDTATFISSL